MAHPNAPLTPEGRRRLCEPVDAGRPICHVAAEAGIARQTLAKWYSRWDTAGEDGLVDRSSRPAGSPRRSTTRSRTWSVYLRRNIKLGPVMLAAELAEFGITLAASTIHRVLVRHGICRLRDLDVTGEAMRTPAVRYEHCCAGDLVHLDVKKIGRIPAGGGWHAHGRGTDAHRASKRGQRPGYAYLHTAIDDRSRLAYTEELADETSVTAATFWSARPRSSPHTASTGSPRCSPTTAPATGAARSTRPWATGSSTATPARIGRKPTERWRDISGSWPANGPTSGPGPPTRNEPTHNRFPHRVLQGLYDRTMARHGVRQTADAAVDRQNFPGSPKGTEFACGQTWPATRAAGMQIIRRSGGAHARPDRWAYSQFEVRQKAR